MEYHSTKTAEVSTKIFELGMKQFVSDVDFVIRYLGFLISINDDTSTLAFHSTGTFRRSAQPFHRRCSRALRKRDFVV
jgi:cleavage stimulation factor subunit 3